MNQINIKEIEKAVLDTALKIAKQGKGCLIVIKKNNVSFDPLIEQDIKPFNILENRRRLETLALVDGACIVDLNGNLIAYASRIKNIKTFKGYGTRHSAGYSASLNNNISILASEEDRKVRIFKNGKLIMQLDALQKGIEDSTIEVVTILESIGAGSLATIGTTLLMPALGITILPGIIIFGSAYYLAKLILKEKLKRKYNY